MGVYILLPIIAGMGATAGLAVIAVLIGRCFLKKGPKLFCYLLWSVVLFRLLCPVSVPSAVSALRLFEFGWMQTDSYFNAIPETLKAMGNLLPAGKAPQEKGWSGSALFPTDDFAAGGANDLWLAWNGRFGMEHHPIQEEIAGETEEFDILLPAPPMLFMEMGVPKEETQEKPDAGKFYTGNSYITGKTAGSRDSVPGWLVALTWIWLAGILGMLLFSLASLFRLRRRLIGAVPLRGNIYQSDYIVSPFVMGVFAPKIYLPSTLDRKEQEYILLHEQAHVRRGDHIVRLLAFAALALHWFNPFVWLAFYLSGKDMEMACDEAVMRRMKEDIRAEYSASLLGLATGRHLIPCTYLAFGEGDVKSRIKNVMRYKKPTVFWVVFAALFVSGTVCVFGSDPKTEEKTRAQQENGGMGAEDGTGARDGETNRLETGETGADNGEKMKDSHAGAWDEATGDDNGESGLEGKSQRSFLTVYSLKDSELIQKLIAGFSSRYPEIEIHCEIGAEGVSISEQIDALTTRLTAGMGPDLLILDGLPANIYQSKGLLTDLSPALEPLAEELQQNILSAYAQEEKVFMLPVHYMVPAIFADEEGQSAAKSLCSLIEYNAGVGSSWKIYLEKYSRSDLLELTYYNYMPEFILPDKSVDETELANFLLFTKWLGDWNHIPNTEFISQYFAGSADVANFVEGRAKVMFMPLCGMDDLRVCADQMEKMAARGIELQWMDGMFFPEGLIGINAWSQKKELANQFVQTVFSSEMQLEYVDAPGFSVNAKVFAQESEKGNRKKDNTDGTVLENEKFAEQMEEIIAKVSKNQMADAAVLQILQEESADYFSGEISLENCIEAIIERLP